MIHSVTESEKKEWQTMNNQGSRKFAFREFYLVQVKIIPVW